MLILEIIGTIVAWKRGWRKYALLPLGIAVAGGFVGGLVYAICGGHDLAVAGAIGFPLDVLAIVALVVMGVIGRREKQTLGR